jgi:beta-N-acetylhexosaminidase
LRGKNLIVLLSGIVLAIAAIVVFAATAAARRGTSADPVATTTAAGHNTNSLPPGAVAPTIGLRPGATSPSADGLLTAEQTLPKLTTRQLAGQRVIYSYSGLTPPASLISAIKAGQVAGVIFFTDNVQSQAQITAVAKQLQKADASKSNPVRLPLLLMTDQEGGQVRRLSWAQPFLSEKQVGASAHPWAQATAAGAGAGTDLRAVGMNVNLAPVLDVYRQAGNFIDEFGRSFSNNPVKVEKLGQLYATAEQAKGVAATVKHFPGLGAAATNQDTDVRPVTLNVPLSQLRSIDERPYQAAIAANVKLVMVSWAIYPALDKKYPAGLSTTIVRGELRNRLGFGGVTITDALEAGALKSFGTIARRSTLAAKAGMDLLLCAEGNPAEGVSATSSLAAGYQNKTLNNASFKAAVERILALRASLVKP